MKKYFLTLLALFTISPCYAAFTWQWSGSYQANPPRTTTANFHDVAAGDSTTYETYANYSSGGITGLIDTGVCPLSAVHQIKAEVTSDIAGSWVAECSNDGATWTTVGVTQTGTASTWTPLTWTFTSAQHDQQVRYYRIGVNGVHFARIGDLRLYDATTPTAMEITTASVVPSAPSGLAATPGNAQVSLSWNTLSNAASYNVKRSAVSGSGYTTVASPTAASYTDTGRTNGTTYFYVVSAVDCAGESGNSAQASATPVAPPSAPTGLAATPGNAQIGLTWTASSGATAYNIKRSTVSGSGYATVASPGATTYSNTGLTNGTTNYYVVSALNAGGESANSSEVNATPTAPPATPTGLAATSGDTQIALSWTTSSGATSYNVKRSTVSGSGYATLASPSNTAYTNSGLTNGTANYYVVSALNIGGESANSGEVSGIPLAAPINLTATPDTLQVNLSWSGSTGATAYNVKRSTVNGSGYATVASPASSTYVDTGLDPGLQYYYTITAVKSGSESSNSAQAATAAKPPAPHAHIWVDGTVIGLYWEESTYLPYYWVRRATVHGGPYTTEYSVNHASFGEGFLDPGTTYYYVVTDLAYINTYIESNNSTEVSATTIPPTPIGLTATGGDTQVVLNWTPAAGATTYNVKRGIVSGGGYSTVASPATPSYTNIGLTNGTTYFFVVTAINGGGETSNSNEASATPEPPVPAVPAGLAATPGNAQVALSWTASPGATSYNVKQSITSGSGYATVASPTTNGCTKTNLVNGTVYYFVVSAVNAGGESANSSQASATPVAPGSPPLPPAGLTVTPGNARVRLSWLVSGGAISYNVYRGTTSGGESINPLVTGITQSSFTDTVLTNGVTYWYTVAAVNANGVSAQSAEIHSQPNQPDFTLVAYPASVTLLPSTSGDASMFVMPLYGFQSTVNLTVSGLPSGVTASFDTNPAVSYSRVTLSAGASVAPGSYSVTVTGTSSSQVHTATIALTVAVNITNVNCGGPDYQQTPSSSIWIADLGGTTLQTSTDITNTSIPVIYQTQRTTPSGSSSFSYSLPVSNGWHAVSLYFAEIGGATAGQRVFDVSANGMQKLTNLDVYADSGNQAFRADVKTFNVYVSDNLLSLVFSNVVGNAAVGAISIAAASAGSTDIPAPGWISGIVPSDDAGSFGDGAAASMGVSLPSGVTENHPGPDIDSYNPVGPSAVFERSYRGSYPIAYYHSPGLPLGWVHNYDIRVVFNGYGTYTLYYPNGGTEIWRDMGVSGSLSPPSGAPYLVSTSGGLLTMIFKDHSQYVFAPTFNGSTLYRLQNIVNVANHQITLTYDNSGDLSSIVNDNIPQQTLLLLSYSGGLLTTVKDLASPNSSENRQVNYSLSNFGGDLSTVSEISAIGAAEKTRWYYQTDGSNYLALVQGPDITGFTPSGNRQSSSASYAETGGLAQSVSDSSGNKHAYSRQGSQTVLTVTDINNTTTQQWTQKFDPGHFNVNTGDIDAKNHATRAVYGDNNNPYLPSAFVNGNNQSTAAAYDAFGNVTLEQDSRGVTTTYDYLYTAFPLGQLHGVQTTSGGVSLAATTFDYDSLGRLNHIYAPVPGTIGGSSLVTTTYTYTPSPSLGNIDHVDMPAPSGNPGDIVTTSYSYTDGLTSAESLGEPVLVTVNGTGSDGLPTTTSVHYHYDGRGNRTKEIDALGNETDYAYNLANQVKQVTYPTTGSNPQNPSEQAYTVYNYIYPGGPVHDISMYDEKNVLVRHITYIYGQEGQVTSILDDPGQIDYTYDGLNRLSTITDGENHTTAYGYDIVGNIATVAYPLFAGLFTDQTAYLYDADHNLTQRTDGDGVVTTYQHDDPESLVTGVQYTYPTGYGGAQIPNVSFSYNLFGRRQTVTDGTGDKSYVYDDLDNLLSATTNFTGGPQNQQISYGYFRDGNRQAMTTPAGSFGYLYDGVRRVKQASFPWTGGAYNYDYYSNGWLNHATGSMTATAYSYNARGFLTSLLNTSVPSNNPLSSYTGMTYDGAGNRLGLTASVPSRGTAPDDSRNVYYSYTDPNHLQNNNRSLMYESSGATGNNSGSYNDNYNNSFSEDLAGNLDGNLGGLSFGSSFNADNQNNQGTAFTYDGNGNPTKFKSMSSLLFDPENRLASFPNPAFTAAYDGDDLRAWRNSQNLKTYYLYDGTTPVVEEKPDGTVAAVNGFGADGWRMRYYPGQIYGYNAFSVAGGTAYAFTYDPQGNLVQRQNQKGGSDTVSFEAFGGQTGESGLGSLIDPVGFGGQYGYYTDPSGYLLLTHRYYDPSIGRFITRDPIGYKGGINLYGFCGNNPVMGSDPSGYARVEVRFRGAEQADGGGYTMPSGVANHAFIIVTDSITKKQWVYSGGPVDDPEKIWVMSQPYTPAAIDWTTLPLPSKVIIDDDKPAKYYLDKLNVEKDKINKAAIPYTFWQSNSNSVARDFTTVLGKDLEQPRALCPGWGTDLWHSPFNWNHRDHVKTRRAIGDALKWIYRHTAIVIEP